MRILIATCNRSIIGGIEKYLQVVIPALSKRGHAVAVLFEHSALAGIGTVDSPDTGLRTWEWQRQAPESIWDEIHQWQPDLVYSQGLQSVALENALLDRYPSAWYAHVYQGTCATGSKCHGFPEPRPCHRKFGPMCLVLHYPRRCGGLNPFRAWEMYQTHAARNARLSDHKAILVASRHMYQEFVRHDVADEKLHLVPLPLAGDAPEIVSHEPAGSILFVGRLTRLKGVDYLMRAMPVAARKLGRPLSLTVAGDGPDRLSLERLARQLDIPVHFTGWLESEQKQQVMRNADLLAVPSLWPEPFGLVGIEAGQEGVPAVGYAVGGITDWLIERETGALAPGDPPTVEGLADAIVRALANPSHYAKLCHGAWELSRRFTLERHLAELEPVLNAVCQVAPSPRTMAEVNF